MKPNKSSLPLLTRKRTVILVGFLFCSFGAAFPLLPPATHTRRHHSTPLCWSKSSRRFHSPLFAREAKRQRSFGDDDDDDDFFKFWDDKDDEYNFEDDFDDFHKNNIRADDTHVATTAAAQDTTNTQTDSSHFFSRKSLADFSIPDQTLFQNLCRGAGISRPSKIQSLAWPALLTGQSTIIADQTGSGKTLAYLIPLILRVLQSSSTSPPKKRQYGAPRVIILAPTAELADQTHAVCDKLSKFVPQLKTVVLSASGRHTTNIRDQIRLLQRQSFSVLISTPGRLATILRTKHGGLDLSQLQSIVLDEVDVLLLDETFGPQLRTLGAAAPVEQTQFVFVTATLPNSVVETVQREFPNVATIQGPGLHRIAPTVKERLVDVSVPAKYNRDTKLCFDVKAKELLKALRQVRCRRTLVFCNTVEHCRQVENLLKRRGNRKQQLYQVYAYHNAMTAQARNDNLASFSRNTQGRPQRQDAILVCTDRAARGVDFEEAPVDHVVLFDFPQDPAEYVRRVGRTARAGRPGHSTVFAFGWQLPIARSVMASKLDSFSVAVEQREDKNESQEYLGGVRGRRQKKKQRDTSIRGNIESGKLWT